MAFEKDKLLDHEYDGITELDNDLPKWWVWLFIITIIWSFFYLLYYHVLDIGYSSADAYQAEVNPGYVRASEGAPKVLGVLSEYRSPFYSPTGDVTPRSGAAAEPRPVLIDEGREADTMVYVSLTDEASLASGQSLFGANCASCHGKLGEGGIGPNLADNYWLHGAGTGDIVKSIKYGYPAKGMIAWRGFLTPEQILQVASYVETLAGTDPPNAKAPQGELVSD